MSFEVKWFTKIEAFFEKVTPYLIIISLIGFSVDTLPNLSPELRSILEIEEIIIVTIFSVEYILRLIVSKPRSRYVFSFFGLIDLVAIIPFYLTVGIDLRAVRVFRFLGLFRALKLAKYSQAIIRCRAALRIVKEELILFSALSALLIFFSAVGIYYFENAAQPEVYSSVFQSLWWAVATLTTVGYGDIYPITVGGKIFTFFVLMIGLGVVAVPTGMLASALSQVRNQESKD